MAFPDHYRENGLVVVASLPSVYDGALSLFFLSLPVPFGSVSERTDA